jgi:hypothetical protein
LDHLVPNDIGFGISFNAGSLCDHWHKQRYPDPRVIGSNINDYPDYSCIDFGYYFFLSAIGFNKGNEKLDTKSNSPFV